MSLDRTPARPDAPADPDPDRLNLGVVAHVDAGKTSLTERLLYDAGAVATLGSVDAGTTRTDALDLERRRGITIRAAVTSFALDGVTVSILDTPGHPDFVAEVERSLAVLDAAVLVLSAVEGVQPQTVALWRALRRLGLPTLLFVNKLDRAGADLDRVVAQVRTRLDADAVPLVRARGQGARGVAVESLPLTDDAVVAAVAEHDDRLLRRWVDGRARAGDVRRAVRARLRPDGVVPVLAGSAITGAGLDELRAALTGLVRRPRPRTPELAATVFAVDRDDAGRRAWVRVWSGELARRDRLALGDGVPTPVTAVEVSEPAGLVPRSRARAGEVAVVRGPAARVGDTVGRPPRRPTHRFPPATLQALVEPVDPRRRGALFTALTELADEDPLIDLRLDEHDGEAAVSLHGTVQQEVVAALLAERYGVGARFRDLSVVHLERVVGTGAASEAIRRRGNPYLAGVGLRVEAAPVGHGVAFSPGVERGNLPPAFVTATEEGVRRALRQGRHGWPVTDCTVTMTSSDYWPRQSKPHQVFDKSISSVAADFRLLAPVVLMAALEQAGTRVCEPVERFELSVPDDVLGPVAALLGRLRGAADDAVAESQRAGAGRTVLRGCLPTASVPDLAARLPDLTSGEAVLWHELDHHAPVGGTRPPSRRRTDLDPREREAWFRGKPR
ncbi:TetM/TetW/TetO/TetS family tetracycline resistance ribosomal protection protein [Nocardioides marinquilinus]|uniref:TetM/TetW/TetO/TetS family tetracycline resistance ribosomal protection protein n=1 Tax=Nocardioides marinquilinus TaxID=1210400 RepID=A0ABP9PDU2_9ACTN